MKKAALQVYQEFNQAMLSKTDAWHDMVTDNVKLIGPLSQTEGKHAFIAINSVFFASIKDSKQVKIVDVGNTVITQIITTVSLPNGEETTLEVSEWYDIKDGKIESLKVYFDAFDLKSAFAAS